MSEFDLRGLVPENPLQRKTLTPADTAKLTVCANRAGVICWTFALPRKIRRV